MRFPLLVSGALLLSACQAENLSLRHGSPLHSYTCAAGKSFLARQVMTGEVEITAGGETRDVTDADGDPIPGGPRMETTGDTSTLTGMPGGPYESCRLDDTMAADEEP